nr:immunoglobulin heavy chain junction region [Macaca mulatta]
CTRKGVIIMAPFDYW